MFLAFDHSLYLPSVGKRHAFEVEAAAVVDLDGEGAVHPAPDRDARDLLKPYRGGVLARKPGAELYPVRVDAEHVVAGAGTLRYWSLFHACFPDLRTHIVQNAGREPGGVSGFSR